MVATCLMSESLSFVRWPILCKIKSCFTFSSAGELENSLSLGTLTSEDLTMYGWAGPTSKATPTDSEMGFALSYT